MREKTYTTAQVARMLNLNPSTINNYVDNEIIKAFKTPGGHRRIAESDLVEFLKKFSLPIPPEIKDTVGKLKVQIIDDDMEFAISLKEDLMFCSNSLVIHINDNGYTGLLDFAKFMPDLLLLDYIMPNMNGVEFLDRLKKHELSRATDVVVVTGYPETGIEEKLKKLGVLEVFIKPVYKRELVKFFRKYYGYKIEITDQL